MEKSEKGEDFVSYEKTDETQTKQINQVIGKQLTTQLVHVSKERETSLKFVVYVVRRFSLRRVNTQNIIFCRKATNMIIIT